MWSRHRETRGSDRNSRGCYPPPPDSPAAPALVPPPPAPGTLPVAPPPSSSSGHSHRQGTHPLREFTHGNSQSLRAAEAGTQWVQGPAPSTCGTGQMPSHPPGGPGRCVPAPRAVSAGTRAGLLTTWTREPAGPRRTGGGSAGEKKQGAGPSAAPQQPWAQGPLV